jgi:hypothetical protein
MNMNTQQTIQQRHASVKSVATSLLQACVQEMEDEIQVKTTAFAETKLEHYPSSDAEQAESLRRFDRDRIRQLNSMATLIKWKSVIQDRSCPDTSVTPKHEINDVKAAMEEAIDTAVSNANLRLKLASNKDDPNAAVHKMLGENGLRIAEKMKRWMNVLPLLGGCC